MATADDPSTPLDVRVPTRFEPATEKRFRDSRTSGLVAVNLNTFWMTGLILPAFGVWDLFADPANWRQAFRIRVLGALVIIGTGLFQKLPGKARWMPLLAKVRLVVAVTASLVAALMLDRGYGFGVAGMVVLLLTGPYIARDSDDLLITNAWALAAIGLVLLAAPLNTFDVTGTIVFALLGVLVSTLLGRVLEASSRRAFTLELEMRREARTDALTGLDNRRAMQERGLVELKRARRVGAPVSVILCDIDHFKRVNDRFGHEAGDAVLRHVGRTLRSALRETDLLGRWGGEEFLALLVETDAATARSVAERMRAAVAATRFEAMPEGLTVSLGVATRAAVEDIPLAWEALVTDADRHLYRAKSEGRNRVVSHA